MRILAIDPGSTESGWCVIDADTRRPVEFGKTPNDDVLRLFRRGDLVATDDAVPHCVIEMIGHYGTGMPAGKTVFDTCVWIGRFQQHALGGFGRIPELILRPTVKAHLCRSTKAKDANVRQALVDRFAPGERNHGKGTKADPGWFYGFHRDVWQAYALAVYAADTRDDLAPNPPREPRTTGYWESH